MMFMRDTGAVFEVFCPERPSSNYRYGCCPMIQFGCVDVTLCLPRYNRLSTYMGLDYDSYQTSDRQNKVPVHSVLGPITKLISGIRQRKIAYHKEFSA